MDGEVRTRAASVKTAGEGQLPEVRQRLAVEYEWCRERGIPWTLVDTRDFDKDLLDNLRFLRSWFRHRHVPDLDQSSRFADCFKSTYARNVPLCELVDRAGRQMRLSSDAAQDAFRHCGWIGRIPVALMQPAIALDRPLILEKGWIA